MICLPGDVHEATLIRVDNNQKEGCDSGITHSKFIQNSTNKQYHGSVELRAQKGRVPQLCHCL
jgi:hypothetical protein